MPGSLTGKLTGSLSRPRGKTISPGAEREDVALTYSSHRDQSRGGVSMLPLSDCPGRTEPVKAVCDRRATASDELLGERAREDGLDRTCPAVPESAAIGSMGNQWPGRILYGTSGECWQVGRPSRLRFMRCC
jgi:hypothetical protein